MRQRTGFTLTTLAFIAGLLGSGGDVSAARKHRRITPAQFEEIRIASRAELRPPSSAALTTPLDQESALGAQLYSDKNLSLNRNQACASCHQLTPAQLRTGLLASTIAPAPGFVDPLNVLQLSPVSVGSVPKLSGALNAPSVGYAKFTPPFRWEAEELAYVGGFFWNGRASTLADQAAAPFLNPVEMAMPSKAAVVHRLKENYAYRQLFWSVYKLNLATSLSPTDIDAIYDAMTTAIAAFERTGQFAKFTSKFDYYMAGQATLTPQEEQGLALFNDKAGCASCHISRPTRDRSNGKMVPAMFTDFGFDNIGAPQNLNIPGRPAPDLGLGGRPDIAANDPNRDEVGKHKVMSLRNIAITPPYGHNGVFTTLEQITHFYNTRDVLGRVENNLSKGYGITGWPLPEVARNVNVDDFGNLGLTAQEEAAIVAFMKTLTDGYQPSAVSKDVFSSFGAGTIAGTTSLFGFSASPVTASR